MATHEPENPSGSFRLTTRLCMGACHAPRPPDPNSLPDRLSYNGSMHIRPFEPRDQSAARQLILNGLGEHFGWIDETRNPDLDNIAASYLARGHVFVVAEPHPGGELTGAGALLVSVEGGGQIVRMSVAPAHRRHGLGRELVHHLVEAARQRRLPRVIVETNNDWYDPIRLYQRCGFSEYHRDEESVYLLHSLIPTRQDGG